MYLAPTPLPKINGTYTGNSIVPWRYHFNTVTFSYTAAFWDWEDWELQLDWMALRGINLPLAWVGQEKILLDVLTEAGFTQAEVFSFFSGPAFQAWNRFGNIQGSWGGDLPLSWIDGQFALQKRIIARMVELGMTPVLPCFTGFVPRAIESVYLNATFVNGSQWSGFPTSLTNVTFLEPSDSLFTELQKSFISKQQDAYGNISHIYTLDQFNENDPASGDLDYLSNVTYNNWQSLKKADPDAIWLMQGWLFYSNSVFWTDERIEAYLSGVTTNSDMLILDLFSESQPQWQRTNSYYGKPWIWCQLHGYGGNMGLYGQIENVTINPIEALSNSSSLVGFGLTMEGQEGNEIMYDILLDQAWSSTPLDTSLYFHSWVHTRYNSGGSNSSIPTPIYTAWDLLRSTVYNNTNLTAATAVTKSIFELSPNTTGLLNRTGHHATLLTYDPSTLVHAWTLFHNATMQTPSLWQNEAFTFDFVDLTRQVLANAFIPLYSSFVAAANSTQNTTYSASVAAATGTQLSALLSDLDAVLVASGISHFSLRAWLDEASSWASVSANTTTTNSTSAAVAAEFTYNARNQITLWGPTGQINDYASKEWGGLIGSYYLSRWRLFVNETLVKNGTSAEDVNAGLAAKLLSFEEEWQGLGGEVAGKREGGLKEVLEGVVGRWGGVFGG